VDRAISEVQKIFHLENQITVVILPRAPKERNERMQINHTSSPVNAPMNKRSLALAAACAAALLASTASVQVRAADVSWDNGAANMQWDTSSLNWTGAAWNNAAGDGAIFNATGAGAISVPGPINVNSMNFTVDGYSLNGPGPFNFVNGTSTQTSGVVNVAASSFATINPTINSTVGFQKIGPGTLTLNGSAGSIAGSVGLDGRRTLEAEVFVGGSFGNLNGGFLKLGSANALPSTARVSIGTGYLDIGNNNVTLGELMYTNQVDPANWNTTLNANNGVIGSGTLRVLGDINVMGQSGGNSSNAIAANVDLGGGTQVVRISQQGQSSAAGALIFTGTVSNGSLLKTVGTSFNGVMAGGDGMSLFGNNTYTGSTIINAGQCVIAGTNATTLVQSSGTAQGGTAVTFFGANGSAQSATTLQAFASGAIILDNNASSGNASFIFGPAVAAAQNNDRIRDDAEVQLRDGSFTYRGKASTAATETFGNLNVMGGFDVLTLTAGATGGTATLTANGNLTLAPRAAMQISSGSLSAAAKMFVNGTMPAADSTGILPRIVGTSDFITYNGTTGMTPYTGYATDFSTAGTNVAITAAATVASSVNINALKRTGSFTLTIGSGQTLGITSGMILNTSGTGTITGGTVAFGPKPGVLFGTNNLISAVTGSDGIIFASGTGTLAGDASALTGTMDVLSGTANINTNTFAGPIKVRNGFLNLNISQTLPGAGAITLGMPENASNLIATIPLVSVSAAGAGATFNRDIISDNGSTNAAGKVLRYTFLPGVSPLNNSSGSQTFTGNVTLNTGVRIQGGGAAAGSTGATVFTGNVSGPGLFAVANGRVILTGNYSNTGGFLIGDGGFTSKVSFLGTGSGTGSMLISGGAVSTNPDTVSYVNGGLQSGPIMVWNSAAGLEPQIIPLNNSTINNEVRLGIGPKPGQEGNAVVNVGAGINANWNGQLTGFSPLTKIGTGQLVLGNANNPHTGNVAVSAGILKVNGNLASSNVTVASGATLGGTGALAGDVTVNNGGFIAPGNSIGALGTGNLTITGGLSSEIDMLATGAAASDLLNVTGLVGLNNATLDLTVQNFTGEGRYLLVNNDGSDPVSGTFANITGAGGLIVTVDYAFSGVDSAGRVGNGNDVALTVAPEPATAAVLALAGGVVAMGRRRRRVA
jgi:autotransporter-associated beta strand protein